MTTVQITEMQESPSAAVMKSANAEHVVFDSRGRAITLKKPGVLAQFKIVEILGDTASNQTFMGMVFPTLYVAAIDGDPVSRPTKRAELDALIQRLDEEGIEAIMKGVPEHFGAPDPEKDAAAVKN
jgi:hypothetical protein